MKKTLFILIGIICILAIKFPAQSYYLYHQNQTLDPFDTLCQLEDIKFSELKIASWAKIKDKNSSQEHMESILALIEKEYNLKFQKHWEGDNNHLYLKAAAMLDPEFKNSQYIQKKQDNENNIDKPPEQGKPVSLEVSLVSVHDGTYLAINLEGLRLEDRIFQRKTTEKIFANFGIKPKISQTAVFYKPGFQSMDDQERIVYYLFNIINGIIIEGIKDENFISFSGYTPHFKDSVESRGKKINVNIAARYHNTDNKTYLYMGTPLIHCQY